MPETGKVLVEDGAWMVPEQERPRDWRSMKLTKELTVVHERQELELECSVPDQVSVTPGTQMIQSRGAKRSFVPPASEALGEQAIRMIQQAWGFQYKDDLESAEAFDDLSEFGPICERYETAKSITDWMLSRWVERHERSLRHIGVGSKAIQDLWQTFHVAVLECLERCERTSWQDIEEAQKEQKPCGNVTRPGG